MHLDLFLDLLVRLGALQFSDLAWIYSNGTGSRAACRPQCLTMSGRWLKQLQQKKENDARMNRNTSWYSLMKCVCVCAPQDLAKIAFEARKRHHESESSRLIRMVNQRKSLLLHLSQCLKDCPHLITRHCHENRQCWVGAL